MKTLIGRVLYVFAFLISTVYTEATITCRPIFYCLHAGYKRGGDNNDDSNVDTK